VIGGRNLGAATDRPYAFALDIDGRILDTWDVAPNPGFFLREIALPAGALTGAGDFGTLTVHAQLPDGRTQIVAPASVEQFDLQPVGNVMYGYDTGWHEGEARPPHRADVALGERMPRRCASGMADATCTCASTPSRRSDILRPHPQLWCAWVPQT